MDKKAVALIVILAVAVAVLAGYALLIGLGGEDITSAADASDTTADIGTNLGAVAADIENIESELG